MISVIPAGTLRIDIEDDKEHEDCTKIKAAASTSIS